MLILTYKQLRIIRKILSEQLNNMKIKSLISLIIDKIQILTIDFQYSLAIDKKMFVTKYTPPPPLYRLRCCRQQASYHHAYSLHQVQIYQEYLSKIIFKQNSFKKYPNQIKQPVIVQQLLDLAGVCHHNPFNIKAFQPNVTHDNLGHDTGLNSSKPVLLISLVYRFNAKKQFINNLRWNLKNLSRGLNPPKPGLN